MQCLVMLARSTARGRSAPMSEQTRCDFMTTLTAYKSAATKCFYLLTITN